jgi:hypothetical protein
LRRLVLWSFFPSSDGVVTVKLLQGWAAFWPVRRPLGVRLPVNAGGRIFCFAEQAARVLQDTFGHRSERESPEVSAKFLHFHKKN